MCRRRSRAPIGRGVSRGRRRRRSPCADWWPNLPGAGCGVDFRTVWTFIRREGLKLQKKPCWRASKTVPASPASAGGGRPSRAASIRGGWSSSMKPGPRQTWAVARVGSARPAPAGTGSLRTLENHDIPRPLRCDRIDAPWVLDGPINGESFRVYVERVVVPALAQGDRCDGQLSARRGRPACSARQPQGQGDPPRDPRRRGEAILPAALQSRSQPLEQVFAKLKHFLRKAAERTAPATWRRIGTLLDAFSPDEYSIIEEKWRAGRSGPPGICRGSTDQRPCLRPRKTDCAPAGESRKLGRHDQVVFTPGANPDDIPPKRVYRRTRYFARIVPAYAGRLADGIRAAHVIRNSCRRHAGEGNAIRRCGIQGNRRESECLPCCGVLRGAVRRRSPGRPATPNGR